MSIPQNVILIWTGTNASIPSGWTRETTLDGKYPKAWSVSVAPNNTGGSNTHTHSGSHTHTLTAHTHSVDLANVNGTGSVSPTGNIADNHSHAAASIGGTSGGSLQSTTVTWSSVNHEPPYHTVIFIKPSGAVGAMASGVCTHFYGTSVPSGWYYCDGTNGTPNLSGKYLLGASTGADAGTTGGAGSHQHTVTHGHTANSHTHSGASSGPSATNRKNGANFSAATDTHTHTITLTATTDTVSNYTKTDAGSTDTIDLAYKKLGVIKNNGGGIKLGIVGLWLGSTASIPKNWVLCDGTNGTYDLRDKYIKIGASLANNNETGGSNTHTHSSVSHTHTTTGTHTHTGSSSTPSATGGAYVGGDGYATDTHTHSLNSVSSTSATYSSDNISADTVSHEPAYRTAAYIQLNKIEVGGAFLLYNLV